MIDESMDTEAMAEEPKPWEFRSKPTWQRLIIMLGGVTVNFVLALIIYIGLAYVYGDQYIPTDSLKDGVNVVSKDIGDKIGIQTGDKVIAVDGKKVVEFNSVVMEIVNGNSITIERDDKTIKKEIPVDFIATLLEDEDKIRFLAPRIPFVIGEVPEDSANKNADLMPSDQITKIGDKNIRYFDEAKLILESYKGQKIELGLLRNNERLNVPVIISDSATIGVQLSGMTYQDMEKMGYLKVETKTYSFGESIPAGIDKGITTLSNYVKQLKKIFNPSTGAYKGVDCCLQTGMIYINGFLNKKPLFFIWVI